jgi:glycosidase
MPINPVGLVKSAGGLGSPYAVRNYLQVNPKFGTLQDFESLVARAHSDGLKVIIDWVADHTSWDNPWINHKDWYQQDASGNIVIPPGTNWQDVAALDYRSAPMRKAMISAMEFWVKQGVDGFRCDDANPVPADFWKSAIDDLRSGCSRPLLMLAEGSKPDLLPSGFDLVYDWNSYGASKDLYAGKLTPKQFMQKVLDKPSGELRFVTNHDEAAWNGSAVKQYGSANAAFGAWLITTFTGGVPLIYDGEEVGFAPLIPFFTRSSIDWSDPNGLDGKYARCLLAHRPDADKIMDFSTDTAVVFARQQGDEMLCVIVNPSKSATTVELPHAMGKVHDLVSDQDIELGASVSLTPYQSLVFIMKGR